MPVSLIGTCAVMYLCGFSLDNLSLMALAIASGFVVDDAIVVMENISRHLEEGLTPVQASLKGAQEIGFYGLLDQHLADCGIHSAVDDGRDNRPALPRICDYAGDGDHGMSMVISLTTTPMMCSRVMRSEEG